MKTIKKILVPLDFSPHSGQALQFAIDLARRYEASLDLLYVYQTVTYALPEGYILVTPDQLNEILSHLDKQLSAAKQEAVAAGIAQVGSTVVQGYPINEILHRANEGKADMIVMGTHGRTGIKRAVLGSVAENVLRAASCPVLVVRANAE
jgi:nucleotide-binding universal stress UspA family protein